MHRTPPPVPPSPSSVPPADAVTMLKDLEERMRLQVEAARARNDAECTMGGGHEEEAEAAAMEEATLDLVDGIPRHIAELRRQREALLTDDSMA